MSAMRQVVGVMLHQRHQHHIAFRPPRRQGPRQPVQERRATAAGEGNMVLGVGLDKFQYLRVRPVVGMTDDTGGKVQFAMGIGVMA